MGVEGGVVRVAASAVACVFTGPWEKEKMGIIACRV